MKVSKKLWAWLAAAAVAVSSFATPATSGAATGDADAITYMENMYNVMNNATSMGMKMDVNVDYSYSGMAGTLKLNADVLSDLATESVKATVALDLGTLGSMAVGQSTLNEEVYAIKDGDKYTIYTYDSSSKKWSKDSQEGSQLDSVTSSYLTNPMDNLDNLKIVSASQNVAGVDCVVVYGEITGETLSAEIQKQQKSTYAVYDKEIKKCKKQEKKIKKSIKKASKAKKKIYKDQLKSVKQTRKTYQTLLKDQKKSNSKLCKALAEGEPVKYNFSIDKATNAPVQIQLDVNGFLKSYLAASGDDEISDVIQNCNIVITYYNINQPVNITVPSEALNATDSLL